MAKIFGKNASQEDFEFIVRQLEEGLAVAQQNPMTGSAIDGELEELRQTHEISEAQFTHMADESGGFLEDSPGRLTIPEIRHFRSQASRFGDLAIVLSKYGYTEADVFKSLVQTDPGRYDVATKILSQPDFQLTELSPELRDDKHFIIALIQNKSDFYKQLSFVEQSDPDYALQYVSANLVSYGRVTETGLFDSVPDDLRFDSVFLENCKETVTRDYGRNLIQPGNFAYLWPASGLPDLSLKDFQFWVDFYDGDQEQAFKATVKGDSVPRDVLVSDFLTRTNASEFYRQLPDELKADEALARIALAHDPKTALKLPKESALLTESQTWLGLIADTEDNYYSESRPEFPKTLLGNTELINKIVASNPELLDAYREQPKELRKLLSQLTPENVIVFVSVYSEAFDLLPEKLKHNLNFAKKVVDFQSYSQAAEKLFEIHGEKLAIEAIKKDPGIIYGIPKDVLNLPEVGQVVREQINASQEKEMPYWIGPYFEDHPDQLPGLLEAKPEWFEELLEMYNPSDASKKDLPLQIAKDHFDSFVTTPKRMVAYLKALPNNEEQTMNEGLVDGVRSALQMYSGEINHDVSRWAEGAAFNAVGGKYENQHPEFPEDVIRLLLNKYHVAPSGLDAEKVLPFINFENKDDLLLLLENSQHELPNECISKIYDAIKDDPDRLHQAAKIDVWILQSVSDEEWKKIGPGLVTYIDGDLALLGSTYALLPEDLRADKNLALRAVVADSDNYFYLPQSLLQDQAFVTELCGWADVPAYDLEKMSPAAQVASIARFPSQFHLVEPGLRNDPKFVQACLAQNMWLFDELPADEQIQAWPGFKEQLTQKGFLHADVNSWDAFVEILRTESVSPKRIRSLEGWKMACPDLFSATTQPKGGDSHRVLILVSKEDWNGAFASVPIVDRLAALGIQHVDYREVGSESDVKRILADAKTNGATYDEVFIAGHGTQNSLALGGDDRAKLETPAIKDDLYVDFSDFDDGDFDFSSVLKKGGRLIDLSCSNGEGADKADNLANRFSTTLTPDQTVVASQVPTNITYMDKDPSGHIHVYWMGNTPYLVQGQKSE
jgi:hypothetical protein